MRLMLGTLLVREGVITAQQLDEALRVQVLYGGRLGTNLIELKYVTADTLASWLAKSSGFPLASESMLRDAETDAIALIPKELAEKFECFPLYKDGRRLHVAMTNPGDIAAIDAVSFKTGLRVIAYVVPELVLYGALEKHHGIVRKLRYGRINSSDPGTPPSINASIVGGGQLSAASSPHSQSNPSIPPLSASMLGLPKLSPAPTAANSLPPTMRPTIPPPSSPSIPPIRTPTIPPTSYTSAPASWSPAPTIPHVAAANSIPPMMKTPSPAWRPSASAPAVPGPQTAPRSLDAAAALIALDAARSREEVAAALLSFAPEQHDSMLLFVVREELALGWKGRGLGIHEKLVDNVMVPLNTPSMFQEAVVSRQPVLGPTGDAPLHKHFFKALGRNPPQAAVVVPVLVRNRAVNLIYVDRLASTDVKALAAPLVEVARGVAAAYERILLESRRATG